MSPIFSSKKIARLCFNFYRYYQPVNVVQVGASVSYISCRIIVDVGIVNLISYVVKFYFDVYRET